MKEIKFAPITEKLEDVKVDAQACAPKEGCTTDCKRERYYGNSDNYTKGCWIGTASDAHWTICF